MDSEHVDSGGIQAQMRRAGSIEIGSELKDLYFANETAFKFPGLYMWNGDRNVRIISVEEIQSLLRGDEVAQSVDMDTTPTPDHELEEE